MKGKQLSIPTIMTTQVSSIFGPCIPSVKSHLPEKTPEFDKKQFSMLTPEAKQLLQQEIRKEVVLVGIETHICVAQTAFGKSVRRI
jgi:nicotinamidase-related amidase